MQNSRRSFLKNTALTAAALGIGGFPLHAFAKDDLVKVTILHTNDVHSRIEPFPTDHKRYPGMGGFAQRALLINQIRKAESNVVLLDAGDMFQGTPYFNKYGGELEFKLMSKMGYDAVTLGNHDFDAGLDGLNKQLPHANFKIVSSNYNFEDTLLNGKIAKHTLINRGDIKIGVFGLGIELQGLVPDSLYGNTKYLDPIAIANQTAKHLKFDKKCDLIICLSHLGLSYESKKASDEILAAETSNIDVIIGGHTHTFMDKPKMLINKLEKSVLVNQVGWAGVWLGRLDFFFEKNSKKKASISSPVIVST